ncbi:conjugal transfer protein TrbD [Halodesulfovibrio sp.]|jgi:type IV secretory pathway TrbD component|uniref:conjugal transfer protein TrbD n=1 Tax=Halodesulfovibrio sp. TaxID=1912772 RepID=UPI0025DC9CEA|nr:conjugal transfer protein TrbD [Halodesulfovibrio sp.]MCT4625649.1 conjugal transfer protein TrbD [Halodesulfovibrio sp.]
MSSKSEAPKRRLIPVHQSLHRHFLVMGAERDLVMLSALIAILIGMGGFTFPSAIVAAAIWFVSIFILQVMAKADPQMSRVYRRHWDMQDFYEAKGTPWQRIGWKG